MSGVNERATIDSTRKPSTITSLITDLRALGVEEGMTLMVHSSLSRLGFVVGGAHAVVTALWAVVGDTGTLLMPTHSTDLTDPAAWRNPPVPETWWEPIRAEMPAYDPVLTPTRSMGSVVEFFRHLPGVVRSGHPTVSAAALGPNATVVTADHRVPDGLGEHSPQARLYELDGHVLLLGVSHANNTSLHLAERRSAPADAAVFSQSSPMMVDGDREWVTYDCLLDDPGDFETIGEAFAATGAERTAPVGAGTGRLMRARDVVDFALDWMNEHRTWTTAEAPTTPRP